MRPSDRARYAAAITLSKGKMYEYGVPLEHHLQLPQDLDLDKQFPLAIGTLGDFASETTLCALGLQLQEQTTIREDVIFAAQVLQAYDDSQLSPNLSFDLKLLAAAAFYLGDVPGSADVLAKRLASYVTTENNTLASAVRIALDRPWLEARDRGKGLATVVTAMLSRYFATGLGQDTANEAIRALHQWAYTAGSAHELLLADILGALTTVRMANSAWTLLPSYSGLPVDLWSSYLKRPKAIKELWPSQRMLGEAGLYRGESCVVQMPTSTGKTRGTELVLRAAFLSGRIDLAVVVAPFRALCQEIANDLETAFVNDTYEVNQLSDALQSDYTTELLGFYDITSKPVPHVVVLTPEKMLYVLRQDQQFVERLGLIIYDEGHQFDTGTRGVTYELLLTSIKRLLPLGAQTVLISAVIPNTPALARWLLADEKKVVSDNWLQTRRLIAFTSLPRGKAGQLQFRAAVDGEQEFFVPRIIVTEKLKRFPRERKDRIFPTYESGSIALYLGLRLVSNGGVAIYARTKVSAAKIVRTAVEEIFAREVSLPAPSNSCDAGELKRFKSLFEENFGSDSYLTRGADLGLFAHHGNTPHGIRLAIEHAMREDLIRLIVCTSTLAQGVNLPIRYLLITSPMQGREAIRARDFHNLMGRAGRAGMYGEGTVIFTDHRLYDERNSERRRWLAALQLIRSDSAELMGSTLLSLLEPMRSDNGVLSINKPTPYKILTQLIDDRDALYRAIENLSERAKEQGFSVMSLKRQLDIKRSTIEAIESFLMTYRGDVGSNEFIALSHTLARETLAYSLATNEQQVLLEAVFERVARRVERLVPDVGTQARYGRTLLGIDISLTVDQWVTDNLTELQLVNSSDELFFLLWPFLISLSSDKRLKEVDPPGSVRGLALRWLEGNPFWSLLEFLDVQGAGVPQKSGKKGFDIDSVVDMCEQTFGYEFALFIAAVKAAFVEATLTENETSDFEACADLLQKRLKYGLPSQDAISYFEVGFSDRVVAQVVAAKIVRELAKSTSDAHVFVRHYANDVEVIIKHYPKYFESVFKGLVA